MGGALSTNARLCDISNPKPLRQNQRRRTTTLHFPSIHCLKLGNLWEGFADNLISICHRGHIGSRRPSRIHTWKRGVSRFQFLAHFQIPERKGTWTAVPMSCRGSGYGHWADLDAMVILPPWNKVGGTNFMHTMRLARRVASAYAIQRLVSYFWRSKIYVFFSSSR